MAIRRTDDRREEAYLLVTMGKAQAGLGEHAGALDGLRQALAGYVSLGDGGYQARTLVEMGHVQRMGGRTPDARASWLAALQIFSQLDDPRSEQTRELLDELARSGD